MSESKVKMVFTKELNGAVIIGNIEGDLSISQRNQSKQLKTLLLETQQILYELKQKHSGITDEKQAAEIIEAEIIEHDKAGKWVNFLDL